MKLQSNKNTIVISSIAFCLACLSFGAPTFASYSSLAEESFSPTPTSVENGQKSLADFGQVLGQRLAGVWQEVSGLVGGRQVEQSVSPISSSSTNNTSSHALDVASLFHSSAPDANFFSDTSGHLHASYINLLAKEGIVAGQGGKFYPDNYLRLSDLIKMTVDLYRQKVGYGLSGEQGLSLVGAFFGDNSLPSRYVATALHAGFLAHIQVLDSQAFVSSEEFMQILVNISYQFSGMVRPLEIEHTDTVTRGEAAKYLVIAFDVNPSGVVSYQSGAQTMQTPFMDIFAHPYQTAISTLAGLGIVSVDTPKFSPDNYLHRYDFIIMLVNSLLASRGKTLSAGYISGFVSPFVDVSTASYSPFVYFAYDNNLLSFLTVNKRGQDYFLPDNLMTKYEVYTILSKATKRLFTYDAMQADKEYMTRGEFAQVLVDVFDFKLPEIETIAPVAETTGTGGLLEQISALLQIKALLAKL